MNDIRGLELIIIDVLAKILRTPELVKYLQELSPIPMPSKEDEISRKLWDAINQQATQARIAKASAKMNEEIAQKYYGKNQIEEEMKRASAKTIKADNDRERQCLEMLKKMPLLDVLHLDKRGNR